MKVKLRDINLKDLIEKETGERFNKDGYICCPFHAEKSPSLSIKFFPDKNKEKFKCWGCGESGDAIDFVQKYKNLTFQKAQKYLGIDVEKTEDDIEFEMVQKYAAWQLKHTHKDCILKGIFRYVDINNKTIYYKAKFKKKDTLKNTCFYYHIDVDVVNGEKKVISGRREGQEEMPYNYYELMQGLRDGKTVIVVEGEKDANTVSYLLKNENYIVTSFKGIENGKLKTFFNDTMKFNLYTIGDTGQAGEIYSKWIKKELMPFLKEYKSINLPGLKSLGNNKDVTDWVETGKTKEDLLMAFNRSLDTFNCYELQQDSQGIYSTIIKETEDGEVRKKKYITDFQLLEASRVSYVDDDAEGIKLKLLSRTGNVIERVGEAKVFDDVKSFRNFLGTLDLSFKGRLDSLVELGSWVNNYWALDNEVIYRGLQYCSDNNKFSIITNQGTIKADKSINSSIKSDLADGFNLIDIEEINKDELQQVYDHIFRFNTPDKTIPIIGTTIHDMCYMQNTLTKNYMTQMLIVGESGSGKSTILKNVIAPILNYPENNISSIGLTTSHGLLKDLSTGNYPVLYEEFKPSMMKDYKLNDFIDYSKNLYERTAVLKGNKSMEVNKFVLRRPLIMVGEENYPTGQTALFERSCITYISRNDKNDKTRQAMAWLVENEKLLNKFGKSLIYLILNMSCEEYQNLVDIVQAEFKANNLDDRLMRIATNAGVGIEIFNNLLKAYGLNPINGYVSWIMKNLKEENMEGGSSTRTISEQMLTLFNDLLENNRVTDDSIVQIKGDKVFIKTSEMINQLFMYQKNTGASEIVPLKLRDFKKQASKAGIITGSKVLNVNNKSVRYDQYNTQKIYKLKLNAIKENELAEELTTEAENRVIEGYFNS